MAVGTLDGDGKVPNGRSIFFGKINPRLLKENGAAGED
jgi:hypothetical protein